MKSFKNMRWLLAVMLVLSTLFGLAGEALASSERSEEVAVLISFKQKPGPAEQALIHANNGKVKKSYNIVPTIAAVVPRNKLDNIRRHPSVKSVEKDATVATNIKGRTVQPAPALVTGVKVAVLDTGIDLDPPDLKVAGDVCLIPGITSGDDYNGHGTLVAGIIAGKNTCVNPNALVYSVKVLNSYGSGAMCTILSGIEWAVNNKMQVINISFGSPMTWPTSVIDALNLAYQAGIVIVAGAGNGGTPDGTGDTIWTPARYPSVIAVGAVDKSSVRLSNSSTGTTLELMAPGDNITSTAMGGGYGTISGTSASAPYVAGIAARLIASGVTSNLQVRQTLQQTAIDLGAPGWDSQYGYGLANITLVP